jgi:hypothetical protein
MLCLQRHRWLGQQQTVAAGFRVNRLRGRKRLHQRTLAAGINRDVRTSRKLANPPCIALALRQRQVSGHCDKTHHLQFISRRQRQQDCNGVVEAWIGIDDNPPQRLFLRHSGLAQPGEISGFEQGANLWHSEISDRLQSGDAGIAIVGDEPAGLGLGMWVDGIEAMFADRVLSVDMLVARVWGELSAGRSLPVIDTLIAATALIHGLTLVTRDTRGVELTVVSFIDPWQAG